jgi:hypothetical protein
MRLPCALARAIPARVRSLIFWASTLAIAAAAAVGSPEAHLDALRLRE